jgi:hypothetical protein
MEALPEQASTQGAGVPVEGGSAREAKSVSRGMLMWASLPRRPKVTSNPHVLEEPA